MRGVCQRVFALAVGATVFGPSLAAAAEASALTLPQLIGIAIQDNRDLRAARYAVDIGRARLVQAGLYANPRIDLSLNSDAPFRNEGEYTGSIGVSQEFPVAGRILRQQEVARVDVALAEAEVRDAERRLAGEVADNFYRYVAAGRQVAVRDHLIEIEERLGKVTRDRLRAAEVSELDVNLVLLDLRRLQQERALLLSRQQSLLATLDQQLGRPAASPLALDATPPAIENLAPVAQLQARALSLRADLRKALLDADRAHAEKALAQSRRWQDWTLGLGVEQGRLVVDGAPDQGTDRAVMLSLSIPVPLRNRNQGAIAEADATAEQARARIDALKLGIGAEVAAAHAEASRLADLVRQYNDSLLPISERNVQLAQRGYSQGLVSILEAAQSLRQQGELNVTYLDTVELYFAALVRLHTAAGDYGATSLPAPGNEK